MTEYLLRLLIILPLLGGMIWGCLWLLKRMPLQLPNQSARNLRLVETLTLGPGTKLATVTFGERRILIAASRAGVQMLTEEFPVDAIEAHDD